MKNSVRLWQRKNADEIGRQFARNFIMYGPGGSAFRVTNERACEIVEKAIAKHMRASASPTAVRLPLADAVAFPMLRPDPNGSPFAWLVVLTDSYGEIAYGLAQEGSPLVDVQIRSAAARALAQYQACHKFLGNKLGVGPVHGHG